ncbi:MAG: hypothetical protein Q7U54_00640 [Bacteroidales bacterium]|nr:hypothetical protein [Bacteroidales bacterium]
MKRFFLLFVFLVLNMMLLAQNANNEAAQIKQQMAAIRRSTNWNDPAAAKEANVKLEGLAAKLTQAIRNSKAPAQQLQEGNTPEGKTEMQQEMDDYSTQLSSQMMKIVREGDEGKMDLAEPLREQIAEEYKEDENPTVKNREYLNEMTLLYIDMSSATVQLVIDQMENYRSIKTLVITGGKNGAAVNLENLFAKAAHYPLQQLYIINFKDFVTKVPKAIGNFRELNFLALYNNKINQLPAEISSISQLKSLYIEMNPVIALLPTINTLNKLDTLGIAKTQITTDEINRIKQQLPNCKIVQ